MGTLEKALLVGVSIALIGNVVGLFGDHWWKGPTYNHGLWRVTKYRSGEIDASIRGNLTSPENSVYLVATVLLGSSSSCLVVSTVSSFIMYLSARQIDIHLSTVNAVSLSIAVACGLGCLIFVEKELRENFLHMERSWSNTLCWVGYCFSLPSLVLAILKMFKERKNKVVPVTHVKIAATAVEIKNGKRSNSLQT